MVIKGNNMSEQNNGGPAFPDLKATKVESSYGGVYVDQYEAIGGLSIRDYFAAKALQGFAAHLNGAHVRYQETHAQANARLAYEYADAMLQARVNTNA